MAMLERNDRCEDCGEVVTYGTENGRLVAYDPVTLARHRHQPSAPDAAANRERIQRDRG